MITRSNNPHHHLPLWAWPTALSLDAPTVAIIWQLLLAQHFHTKLEWSQQGLLFLSAWLAYLVDRYFDGFRVQVLLQHTFRHHVARRYRQGFAVLIGLVFTGLALLSTLLLNTQALGFGLLLLAVVSAYTFAVHLSLIPKLPKELLVGILFSAGTGFFLWQQLPVLTFLPVLLLFAILCSLNCLFISSWEARIDAAQGQGSTILHFPALQPRLPAMTLLYSIMCALIALLNASSLHASLSLAALGLYTLNATMHPELTERYRVLADVALLTPLIPLLLHALT